MVAVFKFKVPRKAAKLKVAYRTIDKPVKLEVELPALIQGRPPGSKQELYVAWALNKLKLNYKYQFSVKGGRSRRGGQVIDFMVYTLPLWTPVYVQGMYWHRDAKRNADKLKMNEVKVILRGRIKEPLELWEEDLQSAEMALETVRREVL